MGSLAHRRGGGPTAKKTEFQSSVARVCILLDLSGMTMGVLWCFFGVLVLCVPFFDAIPGSAALTGNKFPFSRQREFVGKCLIGLLFSAPRQHFSGAIKKIPGSTGITANCTAPG
jgi:hypothetical protein